MCDCRNGCNGQWIVHCTVLCAMCLEAIVIVSDRMYEKRTERIAGMGCASESATKCKRGSVCHGGGYGRQGCC